jgi:hypothetical protein
VQESTKAGWVGPGVGLGTKVRKKEKEKRTSPREMGLLQSEFQTPLTFFFVLTAASSTS